MHGIGPALKVNPEHILFDQINIGEILMKAIVRHKYGSSEVLKLVETEKPTPKENQVLIKVHAASINSYDWRHMRAKPFLVRTSAGLLKPKDGRLGADIAGTVEAVGSKVTLFKPGDEVYGDVSMGGYAEYVCAPEKVLALKPANVSFEEAAATPMAALTALQGLRDKGKIQPGQKVLVNGASGGVGDICCADRKILRRRSYRCMQYTKFGYGTLHRSRSRH